MPANDNQQRSQLNTYIYEYFLRNEMYDCARALIQSEQPINVLKNSPGRRRDNGGNALDNGVSPDPMDNESKDDLDSKRPDDLPAPNLPKEIPESCFLMEWWCLFWDMFNAQRGKGEGRSVSQYVAHTQVYDVLSKVDYVANLFAAPVAYKARATTANASTDEWSSRHDSCTNKPTDAKWASRCIYGQ